MELMEFQIVEFLKEALKEDVGRGDWSRLLVSGKGYGVVISKSSGIIAGLEYLKKLEKLADIRIKPYFKDGESYRKGDTILEIVGESPDILSVERTLLNILQHASGIATNVRQFVEVAGDKVKILDTRKTRPLLRQFEKYAVRCGGGKNHRLGLDDALILKDTHLALFKSVREAVERARATIPFTVKIEVECESVLMAREALESGCDIVMCDNMDSAQIEQVVELRNRISPTTLVEVSGNVTLERLSKLVELGVDGISSGALIHQATFKDFSMKLKPKGRG